MKNFLEVLRFEILRSVKKPSYWLAAIALPVILGAYIGIAALVGYSVGSSIEGNTDLEESSIAYYDEANYLNSNQYIRTAEDGSQTTKELIKLESKESGIEAVKSGEYDVFFYIPAGFVLTPETLPLEQITAGEIDIATLMPESIEIYVKPEKVSITDDYTSTVQEILLSTATENINPVDLAVVNQQISFQTITYSFEDNREIDPLETFSKMVAPGLALIAFYILIVVLGNRLVAAMTEEKENRISELLLTSIKPIHLILGKTIALMILGVIQILVLATPIIIALIFSDKLDFLPFTIPAFQISALDIFKSIVLLISSYYVFTSFSILIGVLSPSAKDANSYAGILVVLLMMPFFLINMFIEETNLVVLRVLSFFPPTAPLALMLRDTITGLDTWEYLLGVAILIIAGTLVLRLATYIFSRYTLGISFKRKKLNKRHK